MKGECYRIEDLAEIHELEEDNPRRRHLDSCPRCRARLASYREFLGAPPATSWQQRSEALERLSAVLDREIFGIDSADFTPALSARAGTRRIIPLGETRRIVRGALALAATLLLFVAIDTVRDEFPANRIILRSQVSGERESTLRLDPVRFQNDGSLLLSWQSLPEANTYHVKILDAALQPVASLDAGVDNFLNLVPEQLREVLTGAGAYAWSVTARQNGDILERSQPGSFRLPAEFYPSRISVEAEERDD